MLKEKYKLMPTKIFEECPHEKFVGIVHDELLSYGPIDMLEASRIGTQIAQDKLNALLRWNLPMTVGFIAGDNLFKAK
jgi:hypothetical protein